MIPFKALSIIRKTWLSSSRNRSMGCVWFCSSSPLKWLLYQRQPVDRYGTHFYGRKQPCFSNPVQLELPPGRYFRWDASDFLVPPSRAPSLGGAPPWRLLRPQISFFFICGLRVAACSGGCGDRRLLLPPFAPSPALMRGSRAEWPAVSQGTQWVSLCVRDLPIMGGPYLSA